MSIYLGCGQLAFTSVIDDTIAVELHTVASLCPTKKLTNLASLSAGKLVMNHRSPVTAHAELCPVMGSERSVLGSGTNSSSGSIPRRAALAITTRHL